MESAPGTCDFYPNNPTFCSRFVEDKEFEPEYHVREVIASFLTECSRRPCFTVDLGANNGWFTALMLSLGAHVTAVEPQSDFAQAIRETGVLNCWSSRLVVHNAYAIAGNASETLRAITQGAWRAGSKLSHNHLTRLNAYRAHLPKVHSMSLDDVLLTAGRDADAERVHVDFIKADADGPEGTWLARIAELIEEGRLNVPTIVVECNGCQAQTLYKLQHQLGYHVYLLDMHIDQRFLNARGIDVYSKFQKPNAFRPLPEFVSEMYSIRFLRHVYYLADNMSLGQWATATYTGWGRLLTRKLNNQLLLTREQLLEPRRQHFQADDSPIRFRIAPGDKPSPGGLLLDS